MNYKDMTKEEINYQLEMSDNIEFSYGYAKYLQQRIDKAIEYIKEHNCIGMNKEYLPKEYEYCCSYELLEILGDKE